MNLKIKGTSDATYTDITDYIAAKGINWSLNSIDADGSGRTIDGTMQRNLVASKVKLEVSCVPMTTTIKNTLETLLKKEWLDVQLVTTTGTSTYVMYPSATLKSGVLIADGTRELWSGIEFSLIEK